MKMCTNDFPVKHKPSTNTNVFINTFVNDFVNKPPDEESSGGGGAP